MSPPEYTPLRCIRSFWPRPWFRFRKNRRVWLVCLLTAVCLLGSPLNRFRIEAKEATVNAILLYEGPTGPAYIQISGVLLNGKTELRVCDGVPRIDKRTYD